MSGRLQPYQYVVLRCVPRADREEFVNVGVVLYCQASNFLGCTSHSDEARLRSIDPDLDLEAVSAALEAVHAVCRGDESAGAAGEGSAGARFGYLAAPRSTVIRSGPIHSGLTRDPDAQLASLLRALVA